MRVTKDLATLIGSKYNIKPANVWAAIMQESNGEFSWGNGKIPILVERHKVYKYYKKEYGLMAARKMHRRAPDICNPNSGGYGKYREQYARLAKAIRFCGAEIAHKGTSFGAFQLMGFNHDLCGFDSAVEMSDALHGSTTRDAKKMSLVEVQMEAQVSAWFAFLTNSNRGKALTALQASDWNTYARLFNGSGYAKHGYHTKIGNLAHLYKSKFEGLTQLT